MKEAKWIGRPGNCLTDWRAAVLPAPYLRKVFTLSAPPATARIRICGLGYYELYLNGRKVGDHVLDPVVSIYDKHVRYVTYDVGDCLVEGTNTLGVVLGNGWYNSHTPEAWHFDKAPWRDYPKLLLLLDTEETTLLVSDESWTVNSGPILFDGLRNGEIYDARLERSGWLTPEYDDSQWDHAVRVNPPGGLLQEQTMPACKVMQTLAVKTQWDVPDGTVYDIGQNIAGWARITVTGEAGAEVTLRYSDGLGKDRCVDQSAINGLVFAPDRFQTDHYILKGDGNETWEPRFTYHGFQYVQVTLEGEVQVKQLEARVVHTAFEEVGHFTCSDAIVNRLQECTQWSYIGNFVGIPTDCPHREKNGWTGDAQLATETGLFNYDAASAYAQWVDSIVDVQRPNGQLPGIVPSSGWGYNWGSGPAWDSALLLIPWYVYLYTGDSSIIRTHYDAMKRYVDYCTSMANDSIIGFGLGDWCHVAPARIVNRDLTDTGYYFMDASLLAKFATLVGRPDDQAEYTALAAEIKQAFNRAFYQGNGLYAKGEQTAMGCALYQGLVEDSEKAVVVQRLVDAVDAAGGKPDFGILGAKYVPRVLADHGHVEQAYQLITQPEFPGWVHWVNQGATTLWEDWRGHSSRNHIMFGDISAWFYQYLAGILPDPENPGFKQISIKPHPIKALKWVKANVRLPSGKLSVHWRNEHGRFFLDLQLPAAANVVLPDGSSHDISAGDHQLEIPID